MDKLEIKAEVSIDDAGTITGLAWPFGTADSVGDVIEKGAFSLPPALPIVMEHDQSQVVGVWEQATETDAGLEVKGRLFVEGIGPARKARDDMRNKRITGLSIGFRAAGFDALPSGGRKFNALTITEISLCRRPVHPGARITSVKSTPEGTSMDHQTNNEAASIELKAANENIAKLTARLDKVEAKANRPVVGTGNQQPEAVVAFGNYLRIGRDGIADHHRKALTVANDAPNYVLAPEEVSSEFIRNLVEWSPVRAIADVRTIGTHTIILPKRTGITNAKWTGETVASEGSLPSFDQMEIPVKELTTHVDLSNWLVEDSGETALREVRLALAEDFAKKEGTAFVNGSTAVEPKGFMADAGIAAHANGHAANLSADALISMLYSLPGIYRNAGTWTMNGSTLAAVRKLKDGNGNYLWQPSYQAGQPETILGRPVVELIDMPDIAANAFPIAYGDFKAGYRIYDRLDLAILSNPFILATEGQHRFHARRRVGAGVVRPDAFRKLKMAA
ncbi:phage major capsid protein [Devosia sp. MC532]|uniref:phage major capsid protein n=1 Tax=Devosia sp. MC532 TaxID=2799788 RepID=UPI0018F674F1|nr:phage major capsid protein [Devosia sp. MC532]MBJ7578140.1 phage major capsid protein [Devosia sp. MC532]